MAAFGTLKMLMPLYREFAWDDSLAAADKLIFLGYQPWQFTHALFGSGLLTNFIDNAYTYWVVALYTAVVAFAVLAPRYDRARFFLSFAASWLLIGVIGAYVFASAGPCYATAIGAASAPDFAPLMARLEGNPRATSISLKPFTGRMSFGGTTAAANTGSRWACRPCRRCTMRLPSFMA